MSIDSPYHEGELAVQQRAGATEFAHLNAGAIDETILGGALRFIEQQPMLVIGSIDTQGRVWTSVFFGSPGFIRVLDDRTLRLDLSQAHSAEDDPLWSNLLENSNVGLLVIELGSRRRIRINGVAREVSTEHILIDVDRAYPNCPKYIQRRAWKSLEPEQTIKATSSTFGEELNTTQKTLIAGADTFFVASAHPEHGVDASHRGGHPGFIQIVNNQQLRIPDFAGNSMFNTLGNITSYPYAGLIIIDFERGRLLQLTGKGEILWDMEDSQQETGGTARYWQFDITGWRESISTYQFEWELQDCSPHIPALQLDPKSDTYLSLQVERINKESDYVKSFRLRASDGKELPNFSPGAHLKLKVKLEDGSESHRHYSLLNNCDDRSYYEIAILKEAEGRGGSRYLHEQVHEGDFLKIGIPENEFPMVDSASHSILIAGGIGITPILSMMHSLSSKNKSFEIHYSARTFSRLVFRDRIERLTDESASFYASDEPSADRLNLKELLKKPKAGVHVYVCGPRGMIQAVREISVAQGWPLSQIHFDSFGAQPLASDNEIRLFLSKSYRTITVPADRSILDALLDAGVSVPHDCKRGDCTMCATRVLGGEPDHRDLCLNSEEKASSMCVCVSRAVGEELQLDL